MSPKVFNVFKPKLSQQSPPTPQPAIRASSTGLGAFGGVFTPSILTILGVIMYLRFGWVVGHAGLIGTLIIVTLATSITFLTGLSISQIATDQRVRAGGAYYMISRSLGIEAGGAVGIPLYFAQAISVALYTIGFAESLEAIVPYLDTRLVGIVTTLAVTALALVSAKTAIKAQYFIMVAIVLSLLSFFFGHPLEAPVVSEQSEAPVSFWVVFAVFFPAVTGIMAGVNMSGDLKNPRKAIPLGTLAAIGISYVIYMVIPFFLYFGADTASLIADPLIMRQMSFWGHAILLGVWGATLSSALGSILGAPRILQALARDGVLPAPLRFLGRGSGESDEPRLATYVSLAIALAAVTLGDLNLIAPILSMFFLTTYGVINVVSAIECFLGSPSFRPTFRVPWTVSLLGAVGCVSVMLLINWFATLIAIATVIAIYIWLERRELEVAWGDVRQGLVMSIARWSLLKLRSQADAKNWRPHFLVLAGSPSKRWHLIEFANSIAHNKALLSVASVLPNESITPERQATLSKTIADYLEERGVQALLRVVAAPDLYMGTKNLVDSYGIGSLVPNTVLLGTHDDSEDSEAYCEMLSHIYASKRNLVLLRVDDDLGFNTRKRIDIWWGDLKGNGSLMLTLAYLLQASFLWRGVDLNVKMLVSEQDGVEDAQKNLETIVNAARIQAKTSVMVYTTNPFDTMMVSSQGADLVLLGLQTPDEAYASYYIDLMEKTRTLPAVAFVLAAEGLEFKDLMN